MSTFTRALSLGVIATLVVTLSACAGEPLDPADVRTTVSVQVPENAIVGDRAEVTVTATLTEERADEIETTLQVRAPGGDWNAAESPVTLDAPGEWGFKAVVRLIESEEDEDFTMSVTETVTVYDLTKLTQDLYYDEKVAYAESPQAGWSFTVDNNYPGLWDDSAASASQMKSSSIEEGYWRNAVPDIASLTPDPDWVIKDTSDCAIPQTEPVLGRTFLLTVTYTEGWSAYGYQSTPTPTQVHVTLLDGKLYHFLSLC